MRDHSKYRDYYGEDITDKFTNMVEAFECDFNLAVDKHILLSKLDEIIKDKEDPRNEKILKDIDLLSELSFLLRNGQAKIIYNEEAI